ncbi:MAG: hypothetical protein WDO70_10265 [Alphaproteobacteria bacterium]
MGKGKAYSDVTISMLLIISFKKIGRQGNRFLDLYELSGRQAVRAGDSLRRNNRRGIAKGMQRFEIIGSLYGPYIDRERAKPRIGGEGALLSRSQPALTRWIIFLLGQVPRNISRSIIGMGYCCGRLHKNSKANQSKIHSSDFAKYPQIVKAASATILSCRRRMTVNAAAF